MEKQKKQSLVAAPGGKSYLVPFVLITSLFLLWGFAHGLLDVLNKHFQGVFTMTKAESGLVQFSTYIAYFLMALPAGAFMKRYGYRKGIIMGLLLFAIGAFGFIPAAFLHSATPFLIAIESPSGAPNINKPPTNGPNIQPNPLKDWDKFSRWAAEAGGPNIVE